jgi:hypothetical protein
MYQPTHIDSAAAGIADTPLTIDRPIRATLTYSNRSSKRVRLGFSKMNDKGQWYELWYTWRSYTGLRSDRSVTEKTHAYSQAQGGVKVNQGLFPLDESTLPVQLKDNPCGTRKAFGRELWLKRFGPIDGSAVQLHQEEGEQRGASPGVQKQVALLTPHTPLRAKKVKKEHPSIQENNELAMLDAVYDSGGVRRFGRDYSNEECWKLFYDFDNACPAVALERVQNMLMDRDALAEAPPSKALLKTVRKWSRHFCAGSDQDPEKCWQCSEYAEFVKSHSDTALYSTPRYTTSKEEDEEADRLGIAYIFIKMRKSWARLQALV